MKENHSHIQEKIDEPLNLREALEKYLRHWKWFVLSTVLSLSLVFVYLRYALPEYEIKTSLMVKEDMGMMSPELAVFQEFSGFGSGSSILQNEIQLLQSRSMIESVVDDLDLTVSYYQQGRIIESEIYQGQLPITLKRLDENKTLKELDTAFFVNLHSATQFRLLDADKNKLQTLPYGSSFLVGGHKYSLSKNTFFTDENLETQIRISLEPKNDVIEELIESVEIVPIDEIYSTVLALSTKHANKKKGIAVLNCLVANYNARAIEEKNSVSKKTLAFISDRLERVKEELSVVDNRAETYKKEHKIANAEEQAKVLFDFVSDSEKALFDTTTQAKLVDYMVNYLQGQGTSFELIPANLGFSDPAIGAFITEYNLLLQKRNQLLRSSSTLNPLVVNLDAQLKGLKRSLEESLNNLKRSLEITLVELSKNDRQINEKIARFPVQERKYKDIARQLGVKETLYLYLLQKQEETQISLAVAAPNSTIIDTAYASKDPVSPNKMVVCLAAFLLGLLVPFVLIYLHDLLDNKFHSPEDLKKEVSAPLLGDIPLDESGAPSILKEGERSSTAEAFRLLRTNLDFMLAPVAGSVKTIFVTSTTSGEGKSFIASNLAAVLALSDKKVALLGMDLRSPTLNGYLGIPDQKGITNFLMDANSKLEAYKISLEGHPNLDLYLSGTVPPNPAELLLYPKVETLFAQLKADYDYLVVDTAPVSLVTDTLTISKHADLCIYVARANYLDKRLLSYPEMLYTEKRLPNMAMLINASDQRRGYGTYGSYGYGVEVQKTWWQAFFKK